VTQALLNSFLYQRLAAIRYEDQTGAFTEREIETQYLSYNMPIWYALAWDRLRDNVRFFRIDRIQRVHPLPTEFRLRRPDLFLAAGEPEARPM
jgi:predicted DNA-binding transcriptional regulator YafY